MAKVDVKYPTITVYDDDGIELVEDAATEPVETKIGRFADFQNDCRESKNCATTRTGSNHIVTAGFMADNSIKRTASTVSSRKTQNTEHDMTSAELLSAEISLMTREVK
jgi:hypothetical protein